MSSSESASAAHADLFLLDAANAASARQSAIPRGDDLGDSERPHALGGAGTLHSIVHGTTVGTNTLLERRGPKIGVITTRGFRDVSKCAGAIVAHLGTVGRLPPADRDMRSR